MLLISIGATAAGSAQAQRIENVARLTWTSGETPVTVASNPVVVDVVGQTATLSTFRRDSASPASTSFRAALCGGRAMTSPVLAGTATQVASIRETAVLSGGDDLVFRLAASAANTDPTAIDTITAVLVTDGGDRETLIVRETDVDSGVFVGSIETRAVPPQPVSGDCVLGVTDGDHISIECRRTSGLSLLATARLDILADPFGTVFDSRDGSPVDGAVVTLIDSATGAPARVFAPDGRTAWPSTVQSGRAVTDSAGVVHPLGPGGYRFPLVSPGRYRLAIVPPARYVAPSTASREELARLAHVDGSSLTIADGSFGADFRVVDSVPVRLDIPLDRPAATVALSKTASRSLASPGDVVIYTVVARNIDATFDRRQLVLTDLASPKLRLRAGTIRVDGQPVGDAARIAADGSGFTLPLGDLAAGARRSVSYAMDVRTDAPAGELLNRAGIGDRSGVFAETNAVVRITREAIAARMTIVGRVTTGPCTAPADRRGVGGVRLLLEDGSYAISDRDGRYHFDAVMPGDHVVQADRASLGGARLIDCTRSAQSGGDPASRFVRGQGGSLVTADFQIVGEPRRVQSTPEIASDPAAAGADIDWFAGTDTTTAWLYPAIDHNPRAPAIRIVLRHPAGTAVALTANGVAVDALTFDGARVAPSGAVSVSLWRGVPLTVGSTRFVATVTDGTGAVLQTLSRDVHFSGGATRAELIPARSRLIADGAATTVIAVRLVDRDGRPVRAGSSGVLALSAPYEAALDHEAQDARVLSGLDRAPTTWRVAGDDGIARIALAPTAVSGAIALGFTFNTGDTVRTQTIDTWLDPGLSDWTIVGLAAGSLGARIISAHADSSGSDDGGGSARVALYAKGRILGRWLLTLAYDSARRRHEQRLSGAIDPNAYYSVYADRSERRFDAATTRKLYVRLETRAFRALFGDFETGLTETQLGRYVRAATGLKAEYRGRHLAATAFAARIATRHRRDEFQGNGLSGPYRLRDRNIVANSETIAIEVRDRLRSDRIVSRRALVRFIDYDIDLETGTLRFAEPVLSRSGDLDPQFIVVDYEVDSRAGNVTNAGGRGSWTSADGKVRVGASLISDSDDAGRTTIGALDARVRIGVATEVRAEIAASRTALATTTGWLVEAEHHGASLDLLAYARALDPGYGLSQQNAAERGRRKIGADARLRLTERLSVVGSAWHDASLTADGSRRAARLRIEHRGSQNDVRLGVTYADDTLIDGQSARSTVVEAGATRRLFDNRLELDAATAFALGDAASIDVPARHRLGARYTLRQGVILAGTYEIARGTYVDARTARFGIDVTPWAGTRLSAALADQGIGESGHRAYAAYGLSQSVRLGARWSVDATLDGTRTVSGIDPARVVEPDHPVAAGGFVGDGAITDDFTAVTLGATYRAGRWSATGRGEYRTASTADRAGATLGAIRQFGEGSVLGGLASWTRTTAAAGMTSEVTIAAVSVAHRPITAPIALLARLDYRADSITGAIPGDAGPGGRSASTIDGDARSRRFIGSIAIDWAPAGRDAEGRFQRSEFSLFLGARHVSDRVDAVDVVGFSVIGGADARLGLNDTVDIGVAASVQGQPGQGVYRYAVGPAIGVSPARNLYLSLGYNFAGFADRDFQTSRSTTRGVFAHLRAKFDADSFAWLGIK